MKEQFFSHPWEENNHEARMEKVLQPHIYLLDPITYR